MKKQKPTQFMARLSDCGTTDFRGTFKSVKDPNAVKLATTVIQQMVYSITDSIGQQGAGPQLQYDIACALLGQLNFEPKKLNADVKGWEKAMQKWTLIPKETVNEQAG